MTNILRRVACTAIIMSVVASCGGGGGSSNSGNPGQQSSDLILSIAFPVSDQSAVVHFTGKDIDVAGIVSDSTNGQVTVEVSDGISTTQAAVDVDGNWRASDVPVFQAGRAFVDLEIVARSDSGHSSTASIRLSTQIALQQPAGMSIDPVSNRAFLMDEPLEALFELNLATGDRQLVSGLHVGSGPDLTFPGRLAANTSIDRAYVRGNGRIIEINLTSGQRTVFSDESPAMGPVPGNHTGDMSIDRAGSRLLVAGDDELIAIDLTTRIRTRVSGNGQGTGPDFEAILGVVVVDNSRALVINNRIGLFSIDLGTGNRTVSSDATIGSGPQLFGNMSLALDRAGNRVFVVGSFQIGDLMAVNLSTGNRTDLSDDNYGPELHAIQPTSVAWDPQTSRVLIAAERGKKIIALNTSTGVRSILSDNEIIVGNGEDLGQTHYLSADAALDKVFYGPTDMTVAELNLHTGERTLVYNNTGGTGPGFRGTQVKVYDEPTGQLYLKTGSGLIALELASGNRTLVSDPPLINGPSIANINHMVIDQPGNRILATETDDRFNPTILAIDLTSGLRETLSGPAKGVGTNFANFSGTSLALDQSQNRLLVPDIIQDVLFSVDIGTGDRTIIADLLTGGPRPLDGVRRIHFDPISRRCFLLDVNNSSPGIFAHDLLTGVSTEISGQNTGQGTPLDDPTDILIDVPNNRAFLSQKNGTEILIIDLISGDRAIFANRSL